MPLPAPPPGKPTAVSGVALSVPVSPVPMSPVPVLTLGVFGFWLAGSAIASAGAETLRSSPDVQSFQPTSGAASAPRPRVPATRPVAIVPARRRSPSAEGRGAMCVVSVSDISLNPHPWGGVGKLYAVH